MKKSLSLENFLAIAVLLSITVFSAKAQTNITSNSAVSISSSFQQGNYTASDLVDGNTDPDDYDTGWYSAPFFSGSEWAAFDFGSGNRAKVVRYDLYGHTSSEVRPRKYEFQARDTTTESWVTLNNVSTQIGAGQNTYNITNNTYYRYYRVLMTQNGGGSGSAGFQEVMLFGEFCTHTSSTINETACDSYTSPSGNYIWTSPGTYQDTIPNAGGCDSVITINLTINSSTNSTLNESVCASYTSPSGNYTWTSSGTYQDTIPNAIGCDSVITINLTVNNTTSTLNESDCSSYTSPSGNYTWTSSGTYQDTIPNAAGCDSIITINLSINNTSAIINESACDSYTSPSGNYTWTSSGTYQDTIPNAANCDSIITINLTVGFSTNSTINEIACDSYTSPSGNYTWTSSGTYQDTIPNSMNCDSVITINLTINNATTSNINASACDSYISPSGSYTWTSSGTYQDTIPNAVGCDSVITINLTINNSTNLTINESVCDSYTSPSGNYTWTSSGTYQDTIPNTIGCDSVITINLTINNSTNSTLNESTCDSYTSPSGNYTWTSSGTYQDTIPNAIGCDSVITINLTVGFSTNSTINEMGCGTYTSPSGNYTWTSSGTYQDTIPNFMGCDSVITINLTINSATTSEINVNACASYTSPSGNHTWTSSGTYQDIIPNTAGCDSIITVRLYINNTYVIINESTCDSYTSPSGNYTWTTSGTYKDTIPNAANCDSILTINLTINSSTNSTINESVCDSYTSPSGNYTWTSSGTYQDTLDNSMGCDSILSINLTVNSVDTSVFKEGSMLRSNESGGTYQWIDCSDNSLISGATSQSYTASVDGDYAVIVSNNGCTDTSACYNVLASSAKSDFGKDFVVYPNPTSENVNIDLGSTHRLLTVSITDLNGRIVFKNNYHNQQSLSLELKEYPVGIYFMKIVSEDKSTKVMLIKE